MKALLIAPAFPQSFWSYEETNRMSGKAALAPPLGIITMAALLPATWELRLVDENIRPTQSSDWAFADIVFVTGMIVQKEQMAAAIKQGKKHGKTVVVGGPYATSVPQFFMDVGADYVFRGEAECGLGELIRAIEQGAPPQVFNASPQGACDQRPDMSASPIPRFDLLEMDAYQSMAMQTSRGCPFDCEFCDIVNLFGRKPRYKSEEQFVAELDTLKDLGWRNEVFFVDDNFIGNKTHAKMLLNRLIRWNKENRKPFSYFTQVSINLGQDKELIDLLTMARFGDVFIGVESPEEEVLTQTDKFHNARNPIAESIGNIQKEGISVLGSFIIGFDGERSGAGERICAFVEKTNMPVVMLNLLSILPNTRLWERMISEQRLQDGKGMRSPFLGFNYDTSRPAQDILAEYVDMWQRLYAQDKFLARAYRHVLAMRPTRPFMARKQGAEAPESTPPKRPTPWSQRLRNLNIMANLVWRQGVYSQHRGQFWRQLLGVWRKNPSRMFCYLSLCAIGENMFKMRRVAAEWGEQMSALLPALPDAQKI